MAIKAVVRSKLTTKLLENLESEIRLLKGIKQRNVVELVDCLVSNINLAGELQAALKGEGPTSLPKPCASSCSIA